MHGFWPSFSGFSNASCGSLLRARRPFEEGGLLLLTPFQYVLRSITFLVFPYWFVWSVRFDAPIHARHAETILASIEHRRKPFGNLESIWRA